MSLQFSGGPYINRTFTPVTRADWVNNVTQAVSDAGWSTISGTPGSGSDVTLATAANNQGYSTRFRFLDPGSGNCAQTTIKDQTGSFTCASIVYCLPNSVLWRIVASPHSFWAFMSNGFGARSFVCGANLYVPSFITQTGTVGFMQGPGASDTDASVRTSFRTYLKSPATGPVNAGIWQGSILSDYLSTGLGNHAFNTWQSGSADDLFSWADGTFPVYEAIIGWGGTLVASEAKLKGQLYDACLVNGDKTGEAQDTFGGHTWMYITQSVGLTNHAHGSIALALT